MERFITLLFQSWLAITTVVVLYSATRGQYMAAASGVLVCLLVAIGIPAASLWAVQLYPERLRWVVELLRRDDDSITSAALMIVPLLALMFLWVLPAMVAVTFPRKTAVLAERILPSPLSLESRINYILGRAGAYW